MLAVERRRPERGGESLGGERPGRRLNFPEKKNGCLTLEEVKDTFEGYFGNNIKRTE